MNYIISGRKVVTSRDGTTLLEKRGIKLVMWSTIFRKLSVFSLIILANRVAMCVPIRCHIQECHSIQNTLYPPNSKQLIDLNTDSEVRLLVIILFRYSKHLKSLTYFFSYFTRVSTYFTSDYSWPIYVYTFT